MFDKGSDKTKKSAGSPAFMAPELCRVDHGEVSGRATDVWSMGVTLYCIRYGRLPYVTESILEMQRTIREDEFIVPEVETDPRFIPLIKRLLEKNPEERITIEQLRVGVQTKPAGMSASFALLTTVGQVKLTLDTLLTVQSHRKTPG